MRIPGYFLILCILFLQLHCILSADGVALWQNTYKEITDRYRFLKKIGDDSHWEQENMLPKLQHEIDQIDAEIAHSTALTKKQKRLLETVKADYQKVKKYVELSEMDHVRVAKYNSMATHGIVKSSLYKVGLWGAFAALLVASVMGVDFYLQKKIPNDRAI